MVGIVRTGKAIDRDTGNALQRLRDRTIGKRTDILGGNCVRNRIGIALDVLRVGKRLADTGNDDDIVIDHRRLRTSVGLARLFDFGSVGLHLRSGGLAGEETANDH